MGANEIDEPGTRSAWSEPDRLAALDEYLILDTPREALFDDIVELAADTCDAPIAVINFVADTRQWFKAERGIGTREMPLDVSICRHALLQPDVFVVPDLSQDPRFAGNPLVEQAGGLRFYAGALLQTPDGLPLGTLCILDTVPRAAGLAERQARTLTVLARHVMSELELRRTIAQRDQEIAVQRASAATMEALIATQQAVAHADAALQSMLDAVATGVLIATPQASGATIELVEGDELVYRAAAGVTQTHLGLRIPRASSLAGQAVAQARTLLAGDTERDERVNRNACRRVGARCLLAVPLFRRGEAVGVLKLQAAVPEAFGEREITVAQLFAGVLATAFADAAEAEAIKALRASEAELRERFNALPQMVWSSRPNGEHDFFNDRWYEFTGAAPDAVNQEGWLDLLHPEDRPAAQEAWRHSLATGEPYAAEYRLRHRSGTYLWVLGRALPVRDEKGAIRRWMGTSTDIDDLKRTSEELGRASALLRLIGDSSPDLIYAKDRDSRLLYANRAAQRVIGFPLDDILGRNDLDWAIDKAQAEQIIAHDRTVLATGDMLDVDEVFTDPAGRTTFFRSVKAPLRDAEGTIIGLVGITSDMTQRRQAEERERLLAREIDHRSKNLLAVVQSVVQLTRADDADTLKRAVTGRIQSLARAHSLLAAGRWQGVDMRQLVAEELDAYTGRDCEQVTVDGPGLQLRPTAAQALAMITHELATNAAKYGALSVPQGHLTVQWMLTRGREPQLHLHWMETGGPLTAPPSRRGFGTTVIRSTAERQLHGELAFSWLPKGLRCELVFPAAEVVLDPFDTTPPQGGAKREPKHAGLKAKGRRVLLVEDEAMVALQMEQALQEAGCVTLGPASTILEALSILDAETVDAALIDVNLAGGRSYAVADVLSAKGIPFAFCTGYASTSDLPARFADAAIVTKPVDPQQVAGLLGALLLGGADTSG